MALARSQLARPWPGLRILQALALLQVPLERKAARPETVCVWTAKIRDESETSTRVFNHATQALLGRGYIERCYYSGETALKRKRGGYRITAAGRNALASGWTGKCGPDTEHGTRMRETRGRNGTIWAAIRVKGKFNTDELLTLTTPEGAAPGIAYSQRKLITKYCAALAHAGLLVRLPGKNGVVARYLLARDTGPQPPLLRAKKGQLYDPNTDTTYDLRSDA